MVHGSPRRVSGSDCWVTRQSECVFKAPLFSRFFEPIALVHLGMVGDVWTPCLNLPVSLKPSQKSSFASRILYKLCSSSQPLVQTCASSVGDISTLMDIETPTMTSHQAL